MPTNGQLRRRFPIRFILRVEELEGRRTPATLVNSTTLTYQDIDGDAVKVTLTRPLLAAGNVNAVFQFDTGTVDGSNATKQQLRDVLITALGTAASGVGLTVKATPSPVNGGDGFAAVGKIDATGIDLGAVKIDGDLGRVLSGSGSKTSPALTALTVQSLGRFGTSTQAAGGTLLSTVTGALGTLTVKSDVDGATVDCTAAIGAVSVGGAVIGGAAAATGLIESGGDMGTVKVGGDLSGNDKADTGMIDSGGAMGNVTVGGSLVGGAGAVSGGVSSKKDMGLVTVGGSLIGGGGADSGAIDSGGKLGGAKVSGSLFGGTNFDTGEILSGSDMVPVTVGGDLSGGTAANSGDIDSGGKLGNVKIGGSLLGGTDSDSGEILSRSDLGFVTVGGSLRGNSGADTGDINGGGIIAGVTIKGSLVGGVGNDTGEIISSKDMGMVTVGGDVRGGSGSSTGDVTCGGKLAGVKVGGSVIGGPGPAGGLILSTDVMGPLAIAGNLIGGSISGAAATSLDESGYVEGLRITRVSIGGSVIAGSNTSTNGAKLLRSGSIRAIDDLGPVAVKGSLMGDATNPVVVSASGQAGLPPSATIDLAIASLTVGGRVEQAEILAGYDRSGNPVNGQASIGTVKVGRDWVASSVVAGAATADLSNNFGTATDAEIGGADATEDRIAQIAGIKIGGSALGTVGGTDHFGFVAEQVGSLSVGGVAYHLHAGPSNDGPLAVGATGDLTLFEVA